VRRAALNALPAALVPLALAWVGAARGVAPPAWLAVATVVVVGVLVAWRLIEGTTWHVPLPWLAGLVGWAALAAAVRPVAPAPAAWLVAIGVVAIGLALVAATPRGAACRPPRW